MRKATLKHRMSALLHPPPAAGVKTNLPRTDAVMQRGPNSLARSLCSVSHPSTPPLRFAGRIDPALRRGSHDRRSAKPLPVVRPGAPEPRDRVCTLGHDRPRTEPRHRRSFLPQSDSPRCLNHATLPPRCRASRCPGAPTTTPAGGATTRMLAVRCPGALKKNPSRPLPASPAAPCCTAQNQVLQRTTTEPPSCRARLPALLCAKLRPVQGQLQRPRVHAVEAQGEAAAAAEPGGRGRRRGGVGLRQRGGGLNEAGGRPAALGRRRRQQPPGGAPRRHRSQ